MEDDVPWLNEEQLKTWLLLAGVVEAMPQVLSGQLKRDAGLSTFDYMLLAGLSEAPDRSMRMGDLASFAGGSMSRISHAVGRMETRGWVSRCSDSGDGRIVEARLTEAGLEVVRAAAPGHVREVRRLVIDVLSSEEIDELGRILDKVAKVVSPEGWRVLMERFPEKECQRRAAEAVGAAGTCPEAAVACPETTGARPESPDEPSRNPQMRPERIS